MATVVLLQKVRTSKESWVYILGNRKHVVTTEGSMLEQFFEVVYHIKSRVDAEEQLVIISPSLITMIDEPIRELFPEILFIKFDGSTLKSEFLRRFDADVDRNRSGSRTLFIGADASGGHEETLSAWAWVTGGEEGNYGMGICQFRNNNISEFEGILRAIVENRDTKYDRMHVYSDSKNAIEYFERSVNGGEALALIAGTYLVDLVEEVREIAAEKLVTLGWVRGHRTHRLNTAADCISRHARKSAQSGKNLRQVNLEADAMFTLFNKHYES